MAVRTTVDIPEPLHDRLRLRAERSGTSIRALIIRAIEQVYGERKKGELSMRLTHVGPIGSMAPHGGISTHLG